MILLDTHTWIWWVSDPSELGKKAMKALRTARRKAISAISCFEVAMLAEKGRISLSRDTLEWIEQSLVAHEIELLPLSPAACVKAMRLGEGFHGDPADRLLVATAILESAILITKDQRIRAYPAVNTVW
jgi:PIN domain nuclease of toxin-antitoxin system